MYVSICIHSLIANLEIKQKTIKLVLKNYSSSQEHIVVRVAYKTATKCLKLHTMRGTGMEANHNEAEIAAESEQVLKGKKLSWGKLRRVDSFHLEAGRVSNAHHQASQV